MFDTKISIVVREDLATWQKLNVVAFLMSGVIGTNAGLIGEPYEDGSGTKYLSLIGQPILIYGAERAALSRALVDDLERCVAARGGLTLWVGSDDEHGDTTLGGADLYPDIQGAIERIRNLHEHPYEFYLRIGFRIAGVLPDANGPGKPDIFLAKRVAMR